jgi:hypothetical protein
VEGKIMKYLNVEDCEVDIIRAPFNRSNKYSLIILMGGHSQAGKTTMLWYIANRWAQLKKYGMRSLDPRASCNKWDEWDWKKLTASSAQDFVRLWNNNQNEILALAEASTTMYYMDWMNIMSRVFNSTTTVLGKQHNICFLDTCMETEIMKKARDKVDYRIELHDRDDRNMRANVRSGWTLIDYLRLRWMLISNNAWDCYYTKRMLLQAKKYTDWISETIKQNEAEENERRVGLRAYPTSPEEEENVCEDKFYVTHKPLW